VSGFAGENAKKAGLCGKPMSIYPVKTPRSREFFYYYGQKVKI